MQNNLPNETQSLELIKQALDTASQKGVYPNLETGYSVAIAYNVLDAAIKKLLTTKTEQSNTPVIPMNENG